MIENVCLIFYIENRLFVISWFPQLIHLDDRTVTAEQHLEAKRLYKRPFLEEFTKKIPLPNCLKYLQNKLSTICIKPLKSSDNSKRVNLII